MNNDRNQGSAGLTEHTLHGEVSRVVYENDDQSYTVLRMIDHQGVEHTVVGSIFGAYQGQGIEVSGVWESHKEHGRQFRAKSYKFVLPTTNKGIESYLASGIIPGIGPKRARDIVAHFGLRTLEIMDRYSSRLKEVRGLGKKTVDGIRKAWAEHADRRNLYIYLQGLGISTAYCQRIYRVYGSQAGEVVKENPYRLAADVDGIGFKMADRIALQLGIGKNDEKRLAAGAVFALDQLQMSGHVCYPEEDFCNYCAEILEVGDEEARRGMAAAEKAGMLMIDQFKSAKTGTVKRLVYDRSMNSAETELPILVKMLADAKNPRGRKILQFQSPSKLELSDEQRNAVERAGYYPLSIITGGPGVGKTTVVGEIVRRAKVARLTVALAAPTGRAAKRLTESSGIEAKTIHRLLIWDPSEKKFVYGRERQMKCDLLIVDEVSMLDLSLAVHLFRAIRPGTSVVLVGDADQLPSVGPGRVLHDFIKSRKFALTHLSKIYRQGEGSRIITNAHRVNAGQLPEIPDTNQQELQDFYWIEQDDPEQVVEMIQIMVKERIPKRFAFNPMRDIQVLTPMNRGSCGTKTLNMVLQEALNHGDKPQFKSGERIFKAGDRVMQTVNNYDKNVFNGDLGRICHIDSSEKVFRVRFEGIEVQYEFVESDQLTLAYATTVHKSQGSEFPVVVTPLLTQHFMMLQRNLLYTAMTRAKKLLVLIGSRKAVAMAVKNARLEPRFSMLLARLKHI